MTWRLHQGYNLLEFVLPVCRWSRAKEPCTGLFSANNGIDLEDSLNFNELLVRDKILDVRNLAVVDRINEVVNQWPHDFWREETITKIRLQWCNAAERCIFHIDCSLGLLVVVL